MLITCSEQKLQIFKLHWNFAQAKFLRQKLAKISYKNILCSTCKRGFELIFSVFDQNYALLPFIWGAKLQRDVLIVIFYVKVKILTPSLKKIFHFSVTWPLKKLYFWNFWFFLKVYSITKKTSYYFLLYLLWFDFYAHLSESV